MNDLLVFLYWQFLVLTVMLEAEDSLLVGYRFGMCFKDQSSSMSLSLAFLVQKRSKTRLISISNTCLSWLQAGQR